jgi:hypothetical protein
MRHYEGVAPHALAGVTVNMVLILLLMFLVGTIVLATANF